MKRAGEYGLSASDISFDWNKIQERKNNIVLKLRKGIEFLFRKANIEFVKGSAKIKELGLVEIELPDKTKKEIKCLNIIIATGAATDKIKGFETSLTSDEMLEIQSVPKSITLVGAGAIGVEFASIFNAFGSEVTLVEMLPRIVPTEDEEVSKALEQIMKKRGINILTGTKADPSSIKSEITLTSACRISKKIEVNNKMETKDKGIYGIGDITGISMYAHAAMMQGIAAADNICGVKNLMDYTAVPACTFASPEIASVGITEQYAKEKNMNYKVGKFNFAALGKSATSGEKEGFVKLISDSNTGKILGGHIIGDNASNLIQEIVLAVKKGLTAKDLAETIHAHPTLPEAIWEAAREI